MTDNPTTAAPAKKSPSAVSQKRKSIVDVLSFIGQRLAFGILVLLFVIFLSYLGIDMAGGTPLGPAVNAALSSSASYIGRFLLGDMGLTTAGSNTMVPLPVTEVLAERLPRSLGLLGVSLLLATVVGIVLGTIAARGRSEHSMAIILSTLVGVSVPSFFAAFLLQWAATSLTRQLGRTILPVGGFGWDKHLILPMLVLAARPIAQITRITFVSLQNALQQDYVRTARSKGLMRYQIIVVHVIRNAAIPILTTIGISLRFSLSSLPVVEYYFGWPGMGSALLKGIARHDVNLTVGLALSMGTLFILVNLILDLAYRLIDPRLMETPAHIRTGERQKPLTVLKNAWATTVDLLSHNALTNWIRRRRGGDAQATLRQIPANGQPPIESEEPIEDLAYKPPPEWKQALRNVPLIVGGLMVLGLIAILLFGPILAPSSPFRMQGLIIKDGELLAPPFAPGESYPWGSDPLGRDMMSLILSGAQQTLILAVLAVAARTVVGVILGAIAGWTEGSRLDRLILGLAEVISAFPTLLLAMILILAFGIRQGMPPFVIALCFVGWGEIMQFVRSEVISIRPRPYIESAVAVGARTPRIIGRHILPHLFSALISIIALEMGAVLMLLGELGFIGIFIGGGTRLAHDAITLLYSDVPEWGALLSNVRYYARSYPWTAFVPAMAFFVAILSFNLFGEGFRRSVEKGHLIFSRIINRYTVGLAIVAIVGFNWLSNNSGSMPFYKRSASEFDSARVMDHLAILTDPSMEGRALGSEGMDAAADYIAAEFEALGLQAGGEAGTYFQNRKRSFEVLETIPVLNIDDGGPTPIVGQDFAAYPRLNATSGTSDCPLRFVRLGPPIPSTPGVGWHYAYPDLETADYRDETLVVVSDSDAWRLTYKTGCGMIVVAPDYVDLSKRYTLSGRSSMGFDFDWNRVGEEKPFLWISEEMADRILAASDLTLEELQQTTSTLSPGEVLEMPLEGRVQFSVQGTIIEKHPVRNVLGYLPGWHGYDFCTDCLGQKAIVVLVQYDSPPIGPEGIFYPAANDNASGVAVMLELIRIIQETDYSPPKTFYFAAYSGEGLDNGEPVGDPPNIDRLLQAKVGLSSLEVEAIVLIRGVGAGSGDRVQVSSGGSLRLAQLLDRAARQMGVRIVRAEDPIDISVIYDDTAAFGEVGEKAPTTGLSWEGWQEYSRLPQDSFEIISQDNLDQVGRTLAMALMIMGQEINY